MTGQPGIDWKRVEEIFHNSLEVAADERASYIDECCGGAAELRRLVTELLDGYETQERLAAAQGPDTLEGARFGAFTIVRKVGEGGMGAVYLAERGGEFEQRAAVKVINGTPAAAVLMAERFREERRILAGLEHPNIARLLDGGITSGGQPFLIMEYVEGLRLDRYCEEHRLSIPGRLDLFRRICGAVHFAHQHLVIHRDLKPGNILVDERGEPKLLDFGIARVLAPEGASPAETMTGGMLMTPEFASPEQIQGLQCTVASDVWSLGMILYHLLADRGPFSADAASPGEMIAAVVTRAPARPGSVAPPDRRREIQGDLDGIVMKALSRNPRDRYGSVEQLADDVRRHLEGLPVTAVEGGRFYIARKFIARHRVAVASAALVLVSLIGGLGGTLWQAHVARRERALAEQRFSDARKLANYLLFPLYDSVESLPGSLPVRAAMAGQSLLYLDRMATAESDDPSLRLELAEGYLRLGGILEAPLGGGDSLGNTQKALESDRKAVAILEPLSRQNPGDMKVRQDLARADFLLGPALNFAGKPKDAVKRLTDATAIFDALAAAKPRDADRQVDAGRAWVALMDVYGSPGGGLTDAGSKDRVLAAADKAVAHFNAALAVSPNDGRALPGIARAENLAGTLLISTDPRAGMATIQKGLDALRRMPPPMRDAQSTRIDEARMETMIGFAQEQIGEHAAALATLAGPVAVYEQIATVDPKNATNDRRRMNVYRTRGLIYSNLGNKAGALADYRRFIALADGLIAVDPSKTSNFVLRGEVQGKVSKILASEGRMQEAAQYARASIDSLTAIAERPDAAMQNLCEAAFMLMTAPVESLRNYSRALAYSKRADTLAGGKSPEAIAYLAQAYANTGDANNAMTTIQRGLVLVAPPPPGEKPSDTRQTLEDEARDIKVLAQTGHLPAGFNQ